MAEDVKVAYFGAKASYTHQAAIKQFEAQDRQDRNLDFIPHPTIDSVFDAVSQGQMSFGVVPFENSTNGSVSWTLDIFGKAITSSSSTKTQLDQPQPPSDTPNSTVVPVQPSAKASSTNVIVCDEQFIPVSHCILGYSSPTSTPDTKFAHITSLHTHPQAWGQCTMFLSSHPHLNASNIEHVDAASTSRAAVIAAADPTKKTAAIASKIAAKEYGLEVLAEDIQDRDDNVTRFLILKRKDSTRPKEPVTSSATKVAQETKSLIAFSIAHTMPGALADALSVFKPHKLNLTSINARPSGHAPWEYVFFVEVSEDSLQSTAEDGATQLSALSSKMSSLFRGANANTTTGNNKEENGSKPGDGGRLDKALQDLDKVATTCRWLGSWQSKTPPNAVEA